MTDRIVEQERVRAHINGQTGWGVVASAATHRRYAVQAPDRRRKCSCGCGGRLTHYGHANGLALTGGCELRVRRWVKEGAK